MYAFINFISVVCFGMMQCSLNVDSSQDSVCILHWGYFIIIRAEQLVLVLGIWDFVLGYPTENLLPHTCIRLPLARRMQMLYVAQSVLQNRPVSGW